MHLCSFIFSTSENVHLGYYDSWDSLSAFSTMDETLAVRNRNIPVSESSSIHAVR